MPTKLDQPALTEDVKTVAAVDRALALLQAFTREEPVLSLARLAAKTQLNKSTILRLAQTLERAGYVRRASDGSYSVGPAILPLARLYQAVASPEQIIVPALRELVEETSESAGFHVRVGDYRMCMYKVDSPLTLRDHIRPGDLLPLNRGAAGKMLAAFEPRYRSSHADIRKALFAISRGDLEPDMGGVASPVFGEDGRVTGVISLSGAKTRFHEEAVERYHRLVLAACRRVTADSGGDVQPFDEIMLPSRATETRGARAKS